MNVIATKIQDAVIIEPKVFGDQRGFSSKPTNSSATASWRIYNYPLYRIITHAPAKGFCADSIFKKQSRKESLSESCAAKCLM